MAPDARGGEAATRGPVLVVEDDRPTRELLAAIFSEENLPYLLCANGHEAMDFARANPPVLAILDLHLPSVQGDALATALRIEHGASLPILAMSASYEADTAKRLGAYAYLQKPFDLSELMRLVREGLELAGRAAIARANVARARQRMQDSLQRSSQFPKSPPDAEIRAAG
jgi:DNA-binding response OmpR family regulator